MLVGKREPKEVTKANNELFNYAVRTLNMDKVELSELIDYIEATYGLKKLPVPREDACTQCGCNEHIKIGTQNHRICAGCNLETEWKVKEGQTNTYGGTIDDED